MAPVSFPNIDMTGSSVNLLKVEAKKAKAKKKWIKNLKTISLDCDLEYGTSYFCYLEFVKNGINSGGGEIPLVPTEKNGLKKAKISGTFNAYSTLNCDGKTKKDLLITKKLSNKDLKGYVIRNSNAPFYKFKISELNFNTANSNCGLMELIIHTARQGDFSDTNEGVKISL